MAGLVFSLSIFPINDSQNKNMDNIFEEKTTKRFLFNDKTNNLSLFFINLSLNK